MGRSILDDVRNSRKNLEYYNDDTAFQAIKNIEREELKSYDRFNKLLNTIFYLCDLAGFYIEGRITFVDKVSGKKFK